jgi:hypothetical protein
MCDELGINDGLISDLRQTIMEADSATKLIPRLTTKIITESRWQERVIKRCGRRPANFTDFTTFVTTPPLEGLGTTIETLWKYADQPAVLALRTVLPPPISDMMLQWHQDERQRKYPGKDFTFDQMLDKATDWTEELSRRCPPEYRDSLARKLIDRGHELLERGQL